MKQINMMKRTSFFKQMAASILVAGSAVVGGCTDKNYDLGNLDKTIAIGSEQGLALPGNNSTRSIPMKDLYELPENGIIKVDESTGEYVLKQSDTPESATIVIDEVEMNKEEESSDDYDYNFADVFKEVFEARAKDFAPKDDGMREIKHFSFRCATPEAIKALNTARFNSTINIALDFSSELTASINELKKLVVNVPTYFNLGVNVYQVMNDNSEVSYASDVFDMTTNTLTLSTFASEQKGVRVAIALNGITFNKPNMFDLDRGYYLTMDTDSIKLEGGVNLQAIYEQTDEARTNSPLKEIEEERLSIACSTQVGDITIDGGKGMFKPEINLKDGLGKFGIGELPEFLNDNEVKLRVKNPHIILKISNSINLQGIIKDARVVAKMGNGMEKTVNIASFNIKSHDNKSTNENTTTTIVIANDEESVEDINIEYDYSSTVTSKIDITDLIENIADIDSIAFDCNATTNEKETGEIDLGYEYSLQPDFEFIAPLQFDAGSIITYGDTINGWHNDLEDLRLAKDSYVELSTTVVNQLPMDLIVNVSAVELLADGNLHRMSSDMFDIKVWTGDDETKNLILGGASNNPKNTNLHIRMKQIDKDAFSRLDGIIFKAKAITPAGQSSETIKETSNLKLDNIAIFLKGRVILDLDN